jgi:hypothetical protein
MGHFELHKNAYREQLEGCVGDESIAHGGIPFCHERILRYWVSLQEVTRNFWDQRGRKWKKLAPNLVLTQNAQSDLTHHFFKVHLPPLVRTVDLSEPTHHLQGHFASDLVLVLEGLGQFQDGGRIVRLGERDKVHQEEFEDLVEVRRGEGAQSALLACKVSTHSSA